MFPDSAEAGENGADRIYLVKNTQRLRCETERGIFPTPMRTGKEKARPSDVLRSRGFRSEDGRKSVIRRDEIAAGKQLHGGGGEKPQLKKGGGVPSHGFWEGKKNLGARKLGQGQQGSLEKSQKKERMKIEGKHVSPPWSSDPRPDRRSTMEGEWVQKGGDDRQFLMRGAFGGL